MFGPKYYFEVDKNYIFAIRIGKGIVYDGESTVYKNNKNKIIGVGNINDNHDHSESMNGFNHERVLVDDFNAAISAIAYILQKDIWLFALRPVVVVRVTRKFHGGITLIEIRAILDLFMKAGARKIFLWQGETLKSGVVRDFSYYNNPTNGKLLSNI